MFIQLCFQNLNLHGNLSKILQTTTPDSQIIHQVTINIMETTFDIFKYRFHKEIIIPSCYTKVRTAERTIYKPR